MAISQQSPRVSHLPDLKLCFALSWPHLGSVYPYFEGLFEVLATDQTAVTIPPLCVKISRQIRFSTTWLTQGLERSIFPDVKLKKKPLTSSAITPKDENIETSLTYRRYRTREGTAERILSSSCQVDRCRRKENHNHMVQRKKHFLSVLKILIWEEYVQLGSTAGNNCPQKPIEMRIDISTTVKISNFRPHENGVLL